jgi:signal transduction histidine kinase
LRTPLAGLSTTLEVALRHPESVDHGKGIGEVADGYRRLGRLVNDLLDLASLDGGAPTHKRLLDLAGVVTDGVRRPTPASVRLGVGRLDQAMVLGDASQLARVVTNLVDNALRWARSTVEVSVVAEDSHAVLNVADDGPGVPLHQRENIWGRFVRLDSDRSRAGGGSGLGLALVKELVHAHGGTVAVTDAPSGHGALFVVRLPRRPPAGSSPRAKAEPRPSHDDPSRSAPPARAGADEGPGRRMPVGATRREGPLKRPRSRSPQRLGDEFRAGPESYLERRPGGRIVRSKAP